MNVKIAKGETTITLTKPERKQLAAAGDVLHGLTQVSDGPHDAAYDKLRSVLNSITADGVYAPPVEDAV